MKLVLSCGVLSALCVLTSAEAAVSGPVRITVCAERDRNLLRNGSFEFGNRYNGMKTLIDQGDFLAFMWSGQKNKWCDLGLEQWWGEGPTNAALYAKTDEARSGKAALRVTAPGVATTWLCYLDEVRKDDVRVLTLSWWAKGSAEAAVEAELSLYEGKGNLACERRLAVERCSWCAQANGWRRGTCTLRLPEKIRPPEAPAVSVRLSVTKGTCAFDDVQVESGAVATDYTESQGHFLSLAMEGCNVRDLPKFKLGRDRTRRLYVRNTSGKTLTGLLKLFVDRWEAAGTTVLAETRCVGWKPGEAKPFDLDVGSLAPDAYVALASFAPYFDEKGVFVPENTGWGNVGKSMLVKRNGLRFAVFAETEPRDLFGVGNGMIGHGGWWNGNTMENAKRGKSVRPVLLGEADPYKAALIGAPNIEETGLNQAGPPEWPEACNPVSPQMINAYSPNGRKALKERAIAFGEKFGNDPAVAGAKLDNEGFFVNRGDFCPDKWADLDFRNWLKRRYSGDLRRLNAAWGGKVESWEDVRQPISGVRKGTVAKTGGAAIDWTASMGKMTPEAQARLKECPPLAMDWFRWRAHSVVKLYADFIASAKTVDGKTLYGNNYPWPNYFTHIIWPQWRTHDVIMLDQQYVCGFPRTLGTNEEMIDILEQAESISRGQRPIWGREIYFQPNYPGEMAALQNWAMIAHGMAVTMTFAWKPYADYRQEIFKTGPKSWLKEDAPPMWFLIDTDGSPVPGYGPNARSTDEIAVFHRKYDGRSLKRIRGDVALYFSTDTSAYVMYETFDRPYASDISQRRMSVAAALRYAGARIEYFDDATLGEVDPRRFPVLIAPYEKVVSEKAVAQLRRYAARGGRLVTLTGFNETDENLNPKAEPGTKGWPGDVRSVGGFVAKYSTLPYDSADHAQSVKALLEAAAVPRHAWWENETPRQEGEEKLLAGEGRPIVEVVVRRQEETGRRFVFVLNKGGAGKGRLCGSDFAGASGLTDALTGEASSLSFGLPAFGYRILIKE